ncbi:hypothetical protein Dimus_003119 [Dionaea muscipula]
MNVQKRTDVIVVNDGDDDDNDDDDRYDSHKPTTHKNIHTSFINATEVVAHDYENDDGGVDSAYKETMDAARRQDAVKKDDVLLNMQNKAPPQDFISVDADLEVVCVNTAEMEVDNFDQNPSTIDEDAELFGIDIVDTFIKISIQKTVHEIFEDIADKVDMNLAEEVVKEIKGDVVEKTADIVVSEARDKENTSINGQSEEKGVADEPLIYKRSKKARRSNLRRSQVILDSKKEVDDESANPKDDISTGVSRDHDNIDKGDSFADIPVSGTAFCDESATAPPKDDVVLTISRDMDGEAFGMEIVMFQAPTSASNQEPAPAPTHGAHSTYVDMSAHIE